MTLNDLDLTPRGLPHAAVGAGVWLALDSQKTDEVTGSHPAVRMAFHLVQLLLHARSLSLSPQPKLSHQTVA